MYFHYERRRRLRSTRTLPLDSGIKRATWHIRKCSYQPDTEKVAVSRGVKEPATLSLVCHVPILTNSLWHTVIEKMTAGTVLPEKMITLERAQWEEVSRNKRHFHDFTSGIWMLWKLACTQRSGLFQCEVGLMSDSWHTADMESVFISVSVCWIKYLYWWSFTGLVCCFIPWRLNVSWLFIRDMDVEIEIQWLIGYNAVDLSSTSNCLTQMCSMSSL